MASLSLTRAWNETAAFVKAEARLLFPLAFMLVALPVGLMEAMIPRASIGERPEAGPWLALLAVAVIGSLLSNIAISDLALRPGTSVGEALRRAARRLPAMAGAALLVCLALVAIFFFISVVVTIAVPGAAEAAAAGAMNSVMQKVVLFTLLALLAVILIVSSRLLLMPAVAASESVGPFSIISRSWRLTAASRGRLLGFVALVGALVLVLRLAAAIVLGSLVIVAAGRPDPGTLSAVLIILIGAIVNMIVSAYLATLAARIYAQLAPDHPTSGS